jgi:hypothetical protein
MVNYSVKKFKNWILNKGFILYSIEMGPMSPEVDQIRAGNKRINPMARNVFSASYRNAAKNFDIYLKYLDDHECLFTLKLIVGLGEFTLQDLQFKDLKFIQETIIKYV